MTTTINASTVSGLVNSADTSGILQLQTASTAALTIDANQRTAFVAGTAALPAITTTGDTNTGIWFPAADTIAFSEGGTESMRIDSSGNLGVGTSSPNTRIQSTVGSNGSGVVVGLRLQNVGTTAGDGAKILFTAGTSTNGAGISSTGVALDSADLRFDTGGSNERMRIDSSGSLLINKTSRQADERLGITGNSGQQCAILVSPISGDYDMINFRNTNGQVGRIGCNGTATSYITSSDYRLKENIAPMTGALAKVAQLKPVIYKWKVNGSDGQGFIAHELAEVVPDCVSGEKDAIDANGDIQPQGIDTSFLVATLTAAIQELKAINDTQAETINALTARIVALESK
jgi:hypothetical protein